MNWFQRFPDRLVHEQEALGNLLSQGWVKRVVWAVDESAGTVSAEVDFEAGGKLREVRLVYPFVYPFCPMQVLPRAEGERWSIHQWPSGELCLEMRADNWHTDFNGADMLISARNLLGTEALVDDAGNAMRVPTTHHVTPAQLLHFKAARLVISDAMIAEVIRRGVDVHGMDLTAVDHENCVVHFAVGLVGSAKHDAWVDVGIPSRLLAKPNRLARVAVLQKGDARHLALLDKNLSPDEVWAQFSSIAYSGYGVAIGLLDGQVLAKWLGEKAYDLAKVPMDYQQRAPTRNNAMAGKRVAIVGCGSMGRKVAASLARAGVTDFYLVDGDVMKIANIVRNDLDWTAVGAHKVDGVTERLQAINPEIKVDGWIGHLGGQFSTANLVTSLSKLADCDLIVETTASGQGFGIAAHVATMDDIPMVWGRVFGGGYGGYVARSRPGLEADALDVRHEIYTWMTNPEFPKPPKDSDIDYGVEPDDQPSMIADDADVSVIAAHLARMALDALLPANESDYPHSAYVIGLRAEWIFAEPFQTFPIKLRPPPPLGGIGANLSTAATVLPDFVPPPEQ